MENALLVEYAAENPNRKAADIYSFLESYIAKRQLWIVEIEQVTERYEKRRMLEEQARQSMSAIRRMLAGKKPDHHLAVEYIHYVKKPRERILQLRKEIEAAELMLRQSNAGEAMSLLDSMV